MKQKIKIEAVIGANYGDEGKGLLTDFICKNNPDSLVIMTNGGSQRGHTVEHENGKKHVFHHFGSGTLRNKITYFPQSYLLNPMQFVKEYNELCDIGYKPLAFRHPDCILQLPSDIAMNWHLEKSRGEKKHGSVGCGIWETKYRIMNNKACTLEWFCSRPYADKVEYIKQIADWQRSRRCNEENVNKYIDLYDLFLSDGFIDHFIADCDFMYKCCLKSFLNPLIKNFNISTVVFENGQGLKLDQFYNAHDIHNTTPSFTGSIEIAKIINNSILFSDIEHINLNYVSRTYLTKHGAGNFAEEKLRENKFKFDDETNGINEWQDDLRFAELDYDELFKRCDIDTNKFKEFMFSNQCKINQKIAMTHANEVEIDKKYLDKISLISDTKYTFNENDVYF